MPTLDRSISLPLKLGLLPTSERVSEVFVPEDLSLTQSQSPLPSNLHGTNLEEVSPTSVCLELLQHFSHEHPLILCEEEEDGKEAVCCGCNESSASNEPIYRCSNNTESECQRFILHKSCAELPKTVLNTMHPAHRLQLLYTETQYICDICSGRSIAGFRYSCPLCSFDLHTACASEHNFEPQGHEHSFILLRPSLFTCDACGFHYGERVVSCVCITCKLQVHNDKKCAASFPCTVKQIRHHHKLSLTYSFQLDFDFVNKSCQICNRKMNCVFCVYYCAPCAYIAHVICATWKDFTDDYEEQECHTAAFMSGLVENKEISRLCGEREDQKATEQQQQLLKHFSHPHSLILRNDEPKIDEICDGCVRPISVPFYTCTDQCNFLLHKQCAELPHEIRHPLHMHPLTLKAVHPSTGLFQCYECDVLCNGFTYMCDECNHFFLDVGCSSFLDTLIRHEGHQCDLYILKSPQTICSACGLNCSAKFRCDECNFDLDLRCASLPKSTRHECPKHNWNIRPLKLTYYCVDDSGEHYCDMCEERRGQDHWFYYCEACDYSCHPRCILGKDLIKFGPKNYRLDCHPHSLTLEKKAKGKGKGHPPCATCGDPCKDSPVLVCAECEVRHLFLGLPAQMRIKYGAPLAASSHGIIRVALDTR